MTQQIDNFQPTILFLGFSSNGLQLMAERLIRAKSSSIHALSATIVPPSQNKHAEKVMEEIGLDISGLPNKGLPEIETFKFDLIITLGAFDESCRSNLPGMPPHIHWDMPDPAADASPEEMIDSLRESRDMIDTRLDILFDSQLLQALSVSKWNLQLILDNLLDGVMAHTSNRYIFSFNQAAEEITGYHRQDVVGRDCHEVFPDLFCGGVCEFCHGTGQQLPPEGTTREVAFKSRYGRTKNLRMSIKPLTDVHFEQVGALVSFQDTTELNQLKERIKHHHSLQGMIGNDPRTLSLFEDIKEVSSVEVPVLLQGESGTGKELAAQAIHNLGPKADKPFVTVNCGALPEGVLESELFGHVKGAYTGAVSDKKGRFELAHTGTIFLDEVAELSLNMQVKLLRVLQEKKFERVGDEKTMHVDVRIISATNQDLRRLMDQKKFRKDLYYRLCVVPIEVPPLRERRLDIPVLVEYFLDLISKELDRPKLAPSNEVLDYLNRYPWPGNIRELRNTLEYVYVKCRSGAELHVEHLPPEIVQNGPLETKRGSPRKMSKEDLLHALSQAEGNRKRAAELLGVSRATLYRHLETLGLK